MAPTQAQIQTLVAKGYSTPQIQALLKNPTALRAALSTSRNPTPQRSLDPLTGGGARDPFTGQVGTTRDPFNGGNLPQSAPQAARNTGGPTTLGNIGRTIAQQALGNFNLGALGNVARRVADIATTGGKAIGAGLKTDLGGPAVGGKRGANNPAPGGFPDSGDYGGVDYNPEPFQAPSFEYRDFTDQARNQVAGVYDPRYRAIDAAAAQAEGQYHRNDQITAGLYQNLADNISRIAASSAARYKDASQQQTNATNQLVQDTGQNYSSTQNQEAALLKQLGQEESAKDVLGNNSADQAYQQSQAQREGANQNAAIVQQGQGQADYLSNISQADDTAGVAARQQLIARLGDTLQGYQQNKFQLQGDQAQAALSLAQQLSDRDFQLQQANYGAYKDTYGANTQNQQFAANLGLQEQQLGQQRQQAQLSQLFDQQKAQQNQANVDRQYQLDQAKYGTDLATALANQRLRQQEIDNQSQQHSGTSLNDQDPVSRTISQISSATGGNQSAAKDYYDFVTQAVSAAAASGEDPAAIAGNMYQFVDYVKRAAQQKGLDPLVAQAAASSFWQNFYNKK